LEVEKSELFSEERRKAFHAIHSTISLISEPSPALQTTRLARKFLIARLIRAWRRGEKHSQSRSGSQSGGRENKRLCRMARRETVRSAAKLFPALRWLNEFPKVHDDEQWGAEEEVAREKRQLSPWL
jgi:hypothetical protein